MSAQLKELTEQDAHLRPYPLPLPPTARELPPEPEQVTGLPVRAKFVIALLCAFTWAAVSLWIAGKWIADLNALFGKPLTALLIFAVLVVPGFANAFIVASLAMDKRPARRRYAVLPGGLKVDVCSGCGGLCLPT